MLQQFLRFGNELRVEPRDTGDPPVTEIKETRTNVGRRRMPSVLDELNFVFG